MHSNIDTEYDRVLAFEIGRHEHRDLDRPDSTCADNTERLPFLFRCDGAVALVPRSNLVGLVDFTLKDDVILLHHRLVYERSQELNRQLC